MNDSLPPPSVIANQHIDPAGFDAQARHFLQIHMGSDTRRWIGNVGATVTALEAGGIAFPATENNTGQRDAWVTSPVSTYYHYALEELDRLHKPWLSAALRPLVHALGHWMQRARMDDCVCLNNWLVSTNSYPDVPVSVVFELVDAARQRWPQHAIWLRSLNAVQNPLWMRALVQAGALLIPSREVFLFDAIDILATRHADLKKDFAWLRRHPLQRLQPDIMTGNDYTRAADLYGLLYLQKYSRLNPDYSPALLQRWHRERLLELHGLRDADGRLGAVVGMLRFGSVITSPIVGYDTARPQRDGLYRLLAATVLDQARQRRCMVNLSAGVGRFKLQRGGQPVIEYSAVIADHLPASQRRPLHWLARLAQHVGVPILQGFRT